MATRPCLHYYEGRGRAECIRWLLAAADIEFDEHFYKTTSEYDALINSGDLLFQQIPMLDIDGIKMVQTRAILNYIADKANLYGSNLKERAYIDMYVEANTDIATLILSYFFLPECDQEKQRNLMKDRAHNRYFPVFEKALKGKEYLVGDKFSFADVYMIYVLLSLEEFHSDILQNFPNLQAFKKRICELPQIKKFLQPGSKRKPMADATYIATVKLLAFR